MALGDITDQRARVIHRGLEESDDVPELGALMDDFGQTPRNGQPESPRGDIPYEPAAKELPQDGEGEDESPYTAENAGPDDEEAETKYADYNAGKLVGSYRLSSGEIMSMEAFGDDVRERYMARAQLRADYKVDKAWYQMAQSTSLNQESQPDTAWTDAANADPVSDLEEMVRDTIGGETVVMGIDALEAFKRTEATRNLIGANNNITQQALLDTIAGYLPGVQNVMLFDRYYQSSPKGVATNIGQRFTWHVWVGHQADVLRVEPPHENFNPYVRTEADKTEEWEKYLVTRRLDWVRPSKDLGAIMKVDTTTTT